MSFITICATIYVFTFFWLFYDYSMLQLLAFSYFHVDKFLNYIHPQISSYVPLVILITKINHKQKQKNNIFLLMFVITFTIRKHCFFTKQIGQKNQIVTFANLNDIFGISKQESQNCQVYESCHFGGSKNPCFNVNWRALKKKVVTIKILFS